MSETRTETRRLRSRSKLGKYRIEKHLARGGFADVYRAFDTIEGIRVALKLPLAEHVSPSLLDDFKREVRLTARLDHPNILPIKNADFVEGRFVVASLLGDGPLADRLRHRLSFAKAFDYAEQILAGLAHAHAHRVMHGDVKPENFILFGDHLSLADFGVSKIARRTLQASGSGTIGFMAPEQAMGRPSLRSDVFAAGLVLTRLFTGVLPEWPFEWPPSGLAKGSRKLHPDLLKLLERSLSVDPKRRYEDAQHMQAALLQLRTRALRYAKGPKSPAPKAKADWRELQLREFRRKYKSALHATQECHRCKRPVSEAMQSCPWCAAKRGGQRHATSFPARCPRCKRGVKLDWKYCPSCFGRSIGPLSDREYSDKRYSARCANSACERRELIPFMRYCPWCRVKVKRAWTIPESRDRCPKCRWGILADYWTACPWCSHSLKAAVRRKG